MDHNDCGSGLFNDYPCPFRNKCRHICSNVFIITGNGLAEGVDPDHLGTLAIHILKRFMLGDDVIAAGLAFGTFVEVDGGFDPRKHRTSRIVRVGQSLNATAYVCRPL